MYNIPTGTRIYSIGSEGSTPLTNNTLIIADNFGHIASLQCISGSKLPNIGQWISPDGLDITYSSSDPFDVTAGDSSDPGFIQISVVSGLTFSDLGVYTCQIPDENGNVMSLHVGIYLPAYIGKYIMRVVSFPGGKIEHLVIIERFLRLQHISGMQLSCDIKCSI